MFSKQRSFLSCTLLSDTTSTRRWCTCHAFRKFVCQPSKCATRVYDAAVLLLYSVRKATKDLLAVQKTGRSCRNHRCEQQIRVAYRPCRWTEESDVDRVIQSVDNAHETTFRVVAGLTVLALHSLSSIRDLFKNSGNVLLERIPISFLKPARPSPLCRRFSKTNNANFASQLCPPGWDLIAGTRTRLFHS